MIKDDFKLLVSHWVLQSSEALQSMDEVREWNSLSDIERNISTLKQLVSITVDTIENLENQLEETLCDSNKRRLVIHCLDDLIQLPYYLEWTDNLIIRLVLSLVLDERCSQSTAGA